jgi:hypothetical protein
VHLSLVHRDALHKVQSSMASTSLASALVLSMSP